VSPAAARQSPSQSTAILLVFCGIVASVLIYVFYVSPLRDLIERKLFDIRTRLSPSVLDVDDVTVVTIDDATIAALEPGAKDLSYTSLQRIVAATLEARPRRVGVLVAPQVFHYDDIGLGALAELAARDPRLVLGVFDVSTRPGGDRVPDVLRPVQDRIAKADIPRVFRRQIVRDMVVRVDGELPFLATRLAHDVDPDGVDRQLEALAAQRHPHPDPDHPEQLGMKLNYVNPQRLHQIKAEDLLLHAETAGLKDGVVFIGYTAHRKWTVREREATLVNSPWQADGVDVDQSMPVVFLQAIAYANLRQGKWLGEPPAVVAGLQTLLFVLITLAVWRLSVGFASFAFIGGWSVLLLVHALLFSFGNVYVPLADTALISSLTMISAALWRLRLEGRLRALQQARASSDAELAQVQERFLNRFAFELSEINGQAKRLLERHSELRHAPGTVQTAYVRALGSFEELDDYLRGIQSFAMLQGKELRRPPLAQVDVRDLVEKVLSQFESRKQEARVTVEVSGPTPCLALADRTLVGQIVYNLISNGLKYSPAGSILRVELEASPAGVAIRVIDRGPGISAELHERIFEKFYRVKDDYVYKFKGHGLGLFLSRYFADQIDATIGVASQPGQGAAFTLILRGVGA
jgi:signal transduction histidine kinase